MKTLCAVLTALLVWFGATLARVENQRYALTLGMCRMPEELAPLVVNYTCLDTVETRIGGDADGFRARTRIVAAPARSA